VGFVLNFEIRHSWELKGLSPNSDENEISLHNVNTCSSIEVMRIKKMITKDEIS